MRSAPSRTVSLFPLTSSNRICMFRKSFQEFRPHLSGRALAEGFRQFLDRKARFLSKVCRRVRSLPVPALYSGAGTAILAACLLFSSSPRYTTGPHGVLARLPVDHAVLSAGDFPLGVDTRFPPLENGEPSVFLSALPVLESGPLVRGEISLEAHALFPRDSSSPRSHEQQQSLIRFSKGRVSVHTVDGAVPVTLLRHATAPSPVDEADIFQINMFAPRNYTTPDIPPPLYGEATDDEGTPLRWENAAGDTGDDILVCGPERLRSAELIRRLLHGLGLVSTDAQFSSQAGKYRPFVSRYAEKYGLASSLVLAIMHTESDFNPYAVSQSQAVGLMQIVPGTAGNEVYRYLMGTQGTPSLETLFTPEHNIRYGTAYLHLLSRRYFGGVHNAASRQMCVIAAYNGGPGAVMRLFDSNPYAAVTRINELSPAQVYTALTTEMPNLETRRYVELVLGRIRNYSVN